MNVDTVISDNPELDSDRRSAPPSHPLDIDPLTDDDPHLDTCAVV
jgi:hypothetical protein